MMLCTRSAVVLSTIVGISTAGCGPDRTVLGETPTLPGVITDWTQGDGYSIAVKVFDSANSQFVVFAGGTVSASGEFALRLPSIDQLRPFLLTPFGSHPDRSCTMTPKVTPSDLKQAYPQLELIKSGSRTLKLQLRDRPNTSTDTLSEWTDGRVVYSDQDGEIYGDLVCPYPIAPASFDEKLDKGWNIVYYHWSVDPASSTMVVERSGPISENFRWYVW